MPSKLGATLENELTVGAPGRAAAPEPSCGIPARLFAAAFAAAYASLCRGRYPGRCNLPARPGFNALTWSTTGCADGPPVFAPAAAGRRAVTATIAAKPSTTGFFK